MKKDKFIILLICSFYGLILTGQSKLEQKIIELSRSKNQWMIDRDSLALKSVFDRELIYIHSSSKVDDYNAMMKSMESSDTKLFRQELSDPRVRIRNNIAILTGKLALGVDTKGQKSEFNLVITEIWNRKNKNWVLWSRHATRLP